MDVKKIVTDLLALEGVSEEDIKPEADLQHDLGMDSLGAVELVMGVEDETGVVVSDEDAATLKTVGDIIAFVEARLNK